MRLYFPVMPPANTSPALPTDALGRKVLCLARAVADADGRALLVGGYVRDLLLGQAPKDADIEVYRLPVEKLRPLLSKLGRVDCVGESYRVYKLAWREGGERWELDVSLPRRDRKTGEGHRGFEVEGDPFASVEDAARRRDFTLNAILQDPLSGEIVDPFGGQADLASKVLRVVDEAHFGEDSLRVLRAMQFAARFDLTLDARTVSICRAIDLRDLPRERLWGEWQKLLLKAPRPSVGLRAAFEMGILEQLFPYLQTALQRRGAEMLVTVDGAANERNELDEGRQSTLMLAALGTFLGWRSRRGHGIERLLDDLGVYTQDSYDVRSNTIRLVGERKRATDWFRRRESVADGEFRLLSARLQPRLIFHLTRARGAIEAAAWFRARLEELQVFDGPPPPFLMGRHLLEMGLRPGPQIGRIVQAVYAAQLSGEVTDFEAARALAQRMIQSEKEIIAP